MARVDKYIKALNEASSLEKSNSIIKGILMVVNRDDELMPDEFQMIVMCANDIIKPKSQSKSKIEIKYHRPIVTRNYK